VKAVAVAVVAAAAAAAAVAVAAAAAAAVTAPEAQSSGEERWSAVECAPVAACTGWPEQEAWAQRCAWLLHNACVCAIV
jgi:curli biogenesis system outer membrane secretion channel CsgG